MIAPALEEIAGSLGEKVKIVKLNIDENPAVAGKLGIVVNLEPKHAATDVEADRAALSAQRRSLAASAEGRRLSDQQQQALTVLSASGYVEAETRADLSPKITSRITELRVTEGTRVAKGDVIARLDHQDLDAQYAEAQAAFDELRMVHDPARIQIWIEQPV